jgi:hypothetical protein
MADKERAESWANFMRTHFVPTFWREVRARLVAQLIGFLLAVLIIAAQIHYGVIPGNNVHWRARILSIAWPYLTVLFAFLIFHIARTPWLISEALLESVETEGQAKLAIVQRLEHAQQELGELKESPVKMEIKIVDMYRLPSLGGRDRDEQGAMTWDIFLLNRIDLFHPQFASVLAYSFALSRHGQQKLYGMERDVEQWQLVFWNPKLPTTHPMQPLGFDLRRGLPREGWLHFRIDKISASALDETVVRIVADAGRNGVATGERPASWNVNQNNRIGRKPNIA